MFDKQGNSQYIVNLSFLWLELCTFIMKFTIYCEFDYGYLYF
ncbi:hypothetical protein HMPREF2533_01511 [Bacteroides fragilis]|nr:hypothetical protein M122_0733 [Bacteroides fragilis str. 3976T7]EXZ70862.1 hypothetical protein M120_5021 [Bacteroides fragilis str. 3783N1-8]KXU47808.1 hypothetical protein HMPREF2530_01511 [Bacteroides fragilis]KXU47897.1 hypothetical protein HMPREF2533_01511 [Bacteroides fragilis]